MELVHKSDDFTTNISKGLQQTRTPNGRNTMQLSSRLLNKRDSNAIKLDAIDVLDEKGAQSRAGLLRKNLQNYQTTQSRQNMVAMSASVRSKSIAVPPGNIF